MKKLFYIAIVFGALAMTACSSSSDDSAKTSEDSIAIDAAADSMLNAASAEMSNKDTTAVVTDSTIVAPDSVK